MGLIFFWFIFSTVPGVPRGVVNVVYGKGDVIGKAIASHAGVKALAFVSIIFIWISDAKIRSTLTSLSSDSFGSGNDRLHFVTLLI